MQAGLRVVCIFLLVHSARHSNFMASAYENSRDAYEFANPTHTPAVQILLPRRGIFAVCQVCTLPFVRGAMQMMLAL